MKVVSGNKTQLSDGFTLMGFIWVSTVQSALALLLLMLANGQKSFVQKLNQTNSLFFFILSIFATCFKV